MDDNYDTGERSADGVIRHRWDESGNPSVAIVEAVAAATDRRVTELPNLYDTVDTDALGRLVTGGDAGLEVAFSYAGVDIVLRYDGTMEVQTDRE